ncbi:MAG: 30S ribosomal protein S12 methylthiotransferase RimO [bacterium]
MNVYIFTLGCFKNEVDSLGIAGSLEDAGLNIVSRREEADIIIINTCGFINSAKEEAIDTILEFIDYKQTRDVKLIVTGCLVQRYLDELRREFPEMDGFVGLGRFKDFPKIISKIIYGDRVIEEGKIGELLDFKVKDFSLSYFLKISDGCNNRCSYCAIPLIRGPLQVRHPEDILKEAKIAINSGSKEIVLIAQDLTSYDYKGYRLQDLLRDINTLPGEFWIRLLYLHPSRINKEIVNAIASLEKVVKYVDIPLQHSNEDVLKSMGRPGIGIARNALRLIREIPNVIIRTTFIVGYPTETPEAFEDLANFILNERFHRVGFFKYSQEENTPAFSLGDPIPERVKRYRLRKVQDIQEEITREFHLSLIGNVFKVLIEREYNDIDGSSKIFVGRTYMDAPEIDSRVFVESTENITGRFIEVRLTRLDRYDFYGEIWRNE